MKILLLISSNSHSIYNNFQKGLSNLGHQVIWFDPVENLKNGNKVSRVFRSSIRRVNLIKNKIDDLTRNKINQSIINKIEELKPEITISYNDSFLMPQTVEYISSISSMIFYLGDNPMYDFHKKHFLKLLKKANLVITIDSGHKQLLESCGIENVVIGFPGVDSDTYYKMELSTNEFEKYRSDVFFLGKSYSFEPWYLKRIWFLETFVDYQFDFFGNRTWINKLSESSKLKDKFILLNKPMSFREVNLRMNATKLYPVDANPGIIKGIHARVFDTISSGTLPLVEYRDDINTFFYDVKPPIFKNLTEAKKLADFYINNSRKRTELAEELYEFVLEHYNAEKCIRDILSKI